MYWEANSAYAPCLRTALVCTEDRKRGTHCCLEREPTKYADVFELESLQHWCRSGPRSSIASSVPSNPKASPPCPMVACMMTLFFCSATADSACGTTSTADSACGTTSTAMYPSFVPDDISSDCNAVIAVLSNSGFVTAITCKLRHAQWKQQLRPLTQLPQHQVVHLASWKISPFLSSMLFPRHCHQRTTQASLALRISSSSSSSSSFSSRRRRPHG